MKHPIVQIVLTILFLAIIPARIFSQTTPFKLITLGTNQDGRLELFGYAADYEFYHKWQTQPDGNWTPNWKNVNPNNEALFNCGSTQNSTQQIVTAHEASGALILFILNGGRVISYSQTQKNGNFGTTVGQHGGTDLRFIATGQNADGRPELFGVAGNQRVYHSYEDAAGHWIDWEDFNAGGIIEVAAYPSADGSLNCVALGTNGSIYLTRQNGPNAGWLTNSWQNLSGTALKHIAMNRNQDGRAEIFALGGDNRVWHMWQTNTTPPFNWSQWTYLGGGTVNQFTPALVSDGREFIFAIANGGILFQGQTVANQGWTNSFGGFTGAHAIQQIAVGNGLKNSWEVLALGGDGSVYRMDMPVTGPTAGYWANSWENFGQPATNCPTPSPNVQITFTGAPLDPTDNDPHWIYIPVNGTATLSWKVTNCSGCKIGIRGMDGLNYSTLAFTASKLPAQGSVTVNPKETQTTYTITATPAGGASKTASILVQLYSAPAACTQIYYYLITCGTYCKTQAICAGSQAAADAIINAANPGCTINNNISNQEFNDGCN
jgi:hypothetical protein